MCAMEVSIDYVKKTKILDRGSSLHNGCVQWKDSAADGTRDLQCKKINTKQELERGENKG